MALNGTWGARQQIVAHKAEVATQPELGMSPFNIPEGYFVYAQGKRVKGIRSVDEVEYACDLHLQKIEKDGEITGIVVLGMQFMCPRCSMGLFIPSALHPGSSDSGHARPMEVHWDKMTQAESDKKFRPTVSIEGPIACDYSWHEIDGIPCPPTAIRVPCGWVGVLEEGRLYDHDRGSSLVLPAGVSG